MARVKAVPLTLAVVLSLWTGTRQPIAAQPSCVPGITENAAQRARRVAGIRLVRAINTAEANGSHRAGGLYQPLDALGIDLGTAPGFEPRFTTDGQSYSLILRDITDPCGFVLSTDQAGVIYQGYPIDYNVQVIPR